MTVTTGTDGVLYWGIESVFLNAGAFANSDLNQPFNPIEGGVDLPVPFYNEILIYTSESLEPNANLSYATEFKDGEEPFPSEKGHVYHDPFPMLALVFTKKTNTGTWAVGNSDVNGILKGNFLTNSHVNTIQIQYKVVDDAGTVVEEKTINGVQALEFRIGFEKGDILRTKYQLIGANETDNSRAFVPVAAYDDGRWADWAVSTNYPASDCKVFWDDSFTAELTDIKLEKFDMIVRIPKEHLKTADSLKTQYTKKEKRSYSAEAEGLVFGDTELDEFRLAYASKAKKNLRLQWDSTASQTKFIDIDDAFISEMTSTRLPGADEAYRVTLTFKGFSCDYEGNFNAKPDPGARVTT